MKFVSVIVLCSLIIFNSGCANRSGVIKAPKEDVPGSYTPDNKIIIPPDSGLDYGSGYLKMMLTLAVIFSVAKAISPEEKE